MNIIINNKRKNVIKGFINESENNELIYNTILDILSVAGYEITTEDKDYILNLDYNLNNFEN